MIFKNKKLYATYDLKEYAKVTEILSENESAIPSESRIWPVRTCLNHNAVLKGPWELMVIR